MEIKSSQFDMSDPFAQIKQRITTAETFLRQMPLAQREQLLAEMLPAMPAHRSLPSSEGAAHMVTVKVEEWDGGPVEQRSQPTVINRPRRIARHISWQWRLIVASIRLTRMMRRSAKQQMKHFNKLQRQMLRRVLPRHKPMRGARAR